MIQELLDRSTVVRRKNLIRILESYIRLKAERDGNAPTLREIGEDVGIAVSGVMHYITILREEGVMYPHGKSSLLTEGWLNVAERIGMDRGKLLERMNQGVYVGENNEVYFSE